MLKYESSYIEGVTYNGQDVHTVRFNNNNSTVTVFRKKRSYAKSEVAVDETLSGDRGDKNYTLNFTGAYPAMDMMLHELVLELLFDSTNAWGNNNTVNVILQYNRYNGHAIKVEMQLTAIGEFSTNSYEGNAVVKHRHNNGSWVEDITKTFSASGELKVTVALGLGIAPDTYENLGRMYYRVDSGSENSQRSYVGDVIATAYAFDDYTTTANTNTLDVKWVDGAEKNDTLAIKLIGYIG